MAERLAAAPPGMAAAERDVLLATKLHMLVPRPGLVVRSRLAGQLDKARARGVILVCAPAGRGTMAGLPDQSANRRRVAATTGITLSNKGSRRERVRSRRSVCRGPRTIPAGCGHLEPAVLARRRRCGF